MRTPLVVAFLADLDEVLVGALKPGRPHLAFLVPDGAETVPQPGVAPERPVLDQRADLQPVGGVLRHSLPHAWPDLSGSATSLLSEFKRQTSTSGERSWQGLQGKVAIVTGGAKGIGRHYSQALAAEGARVMIADIADGKELAAEIAGRHGADGVASATFDVSDETAVKGLVAQTVERFGRIDILVNNAALYSTLHPQKFQRMGRRNCGTE